MPALPRTGIATVDAVDGEAAAVSVSVLAVSLLAPTISSLADHKAALTEQRKKLRADSALTR